MALSKRETQQLLLQVINSYGDLPNSELLRRYGFVETEASPHDCVAVSLADLHSSCLAWRSLSNGLTSTSEPQPPPDSGLSGKGGAEVGGRVDEGGSSSTGRNDRGCGRRGYRHASGRERAHSGAECCSASCAAHEGTSRKRKCRERLCEDERLAFLQEHSLVPPDGRFKVGRGGRAPAELLEAARLLLLGDREFSVFAERVVQWRAPQVRPLTRISAADIPEGLLEFLRLLCESVAQRYVRRTGLAARARRKGSRSAERSVGLSREELASIVLEGEAYCASQFKEWVTSSEVQSAESLVNTCSSVWEHIRSHVKHYL